MGPAKLSVEQWKAIRGRREVGETFRELGREYKIAYQSIQKRANREGWGDGSDLAGAVKQKVNELVVGLGVKGVNETPEIKAKAVADEANKIYNIKLRHRTQCQRLSDEIDKSKDVKNLKIDDPIKKARIIAENVKIAKLTADALKVLHEIESRAWDMPEKELDFSKMTRDQIRDVAAGKMPR